MTVRDAIQLLRPWQWTKNGIVFAALVFSMHLLDPSFALRAVAGFVAFCLASSAIYALNDVCDAGRDRLHPAKKSRPVAAGRVRPGAAVGLFALLLAASILIGWRLGAPFLAVLAGLALARLPQSVRGYGHVKHRNALAAMTQQQALWAEFEQAAAGLAVGQARAS